MEMFEFCVFYVFTCKRLAGSRTYKLFFILIELNVLVKKLRGKEIFVLE